MIASHKVAGHRHAHGGSPNPTRCPGRRQCRSPPVTHTDNGVGVIAHPGRSPGSQETDCSEGAEAAGVVASGRRGFGVWRDGWWVEVMRMLAPRPLTTSDTP